MAKVARFLHTDVAAPHGVACITYGNDAVREFTVRLRNLGLRPGRAVRLGGRTTNVATLGQKTVLVIEDDPWTRTITTALLAGEGFAVVEDNGYAVALNKTITPQLKREGLLRDVVRFIQAARKEADSAHISSIRACVMNRCCSAPNFNIQSMAEPGKGKRW